MTIPYSAVKFSPKEETTKAVLKTLSPTTNRRGVRLSRINLQKPSFNEENKVKNQQNFLKEVQLQTKEGKRVKRLLQFVMKDGKKEKARKIILGAILYTRLEKGQDFSSLLYRAVENTSSLGKLRSRRRGSQKLRVPFPLTLDQQESTGLRRLVNAARKMKGPMSQTLAKTVWQAAEGEGNAVEERRAELNELRKNQGNVFLRWL